MKGGTTKYMGNTNMNGSPLDRALDA
jgi:hypothetical protein